MSTDDVQHSNPKNGFRVVTHVIPPTATGQNEAVPAVGVPTVGVSNVGVPAVVVPTVGLEKFLKIQPKALGTIQIMNGLITLAFAIVHTVVLPTFSSYTGVCFWAFLMVKASLIMNVFSAVAAGVAISLLSLDLSLVHTGDDPCYGPDTKDKCRDYLQLMSRSKGISGVMLLFSVLEFFVSICISVFGCRATCCGDPAGSVVAAVPSQAASYSLANPLYPQSAQQGVFNMENPNSSVNSPPPAYSTRPDKPDN
ncbi:membrane-spanning 4-domains subfamily A member 4A-like [Salminus brasiliensis]|uniref:membrane-spanning 4-domains subfamily A member 4A-like n=1 Tax=Salminus brasiliensis TaxID=930266 RepID=UPI003B82DCBC